jgi:aldehyde:ferredoxin oxidoreductase
MSRNTPYGYYGVILDVDLSTRKIQKTPVPPADLANFIGGRGLGMKILWDRLKDKPGLDPSSPDNPLMFMPGPFSGFPAPSSSRTCVVTKSPITSPVQPKYKHSSTLSYANMGGYFGPELRFAGYDGLVVTGKADTPVYLYIDDDVVEIRDAKKYWGMGTDQFDKEFAKDLVDPRFRTCYIGPAGERLVSYASIIHTAGRAAARGGVGYVMGSKNLKGVAVRGTNQPNVADHEQFLAALEKARQKFTDPKVYGMWREGGTAASLEALSSKGIQAVKNYREGTFVDADKIGAAASKKYWIRSSSCYCCPLACKRVCDSNAGLTHDGPEYETGTMLGANLMISDLKGILEGIYLGDDYGMDIITLGNVIGFLMEAYERKLIDKDFLDGIDLQWGSVDATLKMIHKIAARDGIGDLASRGVKALVEKIGHDSHKFAMHVKGHALAAHNCQANPPRALCYATAHRGACHLNGYTADDQNMNALADAIGVCRFALSGYGSDRKIVGEVLAGIIGKEIAANMLEAGERICNLEKLFNCREGFSRLDDVIPDRYFEEPLTVGAQKGAVLSRDQFNTMMDEHYATRGWDSETTLPTPKKLEQLGLSGEEYRI